tara:strand:+ start:5534 stop:5701 length:168 start_codon:yes stop_codon:yes gene_type:complete
LIAVAVVFGVSFSVFNRKKKVHRALAGIGFWDCVWVALLRARDKGGAFRDRSSHP